MTNHQPNHRWLDRLTAWLSGVLSGVLSGAAGPTSAGATHWRDASGTRRDASGTRDDCVLHSRVSSGSRPPATDALLGRPPVELQLESIRQWIDGRVMMVTGSAGSIGSEICRQLARFAPRRIVMVDRWETGQFFLEQELAAVAPRATIDVRIADLLDRPRMRRLMAECRPGIIFHAAAYKHVPLMESHRAEAVRNIVTATRQLADLAIEHGVESLVHISTDKAVNPSSVMGACKHLAERYVASLAETHGVRFLSVRFGNVLDSAGSVVQVFRRQIADGGPVTVTDPRMERYFMTIAEAAGLVVQAGALGRGGETMMLEMGQGVKILDLAREMIRQSGLRPGRDIPITFTGLRPGERLREELHAPEEHCLPTEHPKIKRLARRDERGCWADQLDARAAVASLEAAADQSPEAVTTALRALVAGSPAYGRWSISPPARLAKLR